ncbi:hypothetical protein IEQ44_08375 [Nocardioides sp. Y6]|uniref:Uncharacterized protein n=1 Tax=Nocardioides malaquae TaxID=2773426 RepID=A0ABR9RSV6_9ACTN|nr:hypothetical protein [Nocardioides malaquae]MBE7324667.1 hypothetical protein [Nocardioides malaquae]
MIAAAGHRGRRGLPRSGSAGGQRRPALPEVNVRCRGRGVNRSHRAAAALVAGALVAGGLAACSPSADESQPGAPAARAPAKARAAAAPRAASPLKLPDWWSGALPLPDDASVIAVHRRTCTVTFLDWGTDAQLAAADLELEAKSRGLQTRLVSSVSEVDHQVEEGADLGFAEEVALPPVVTQVVALRMSRAATAEAPAVDASLILTSRGDGGVTGEYALGEVC